LLMMISSFHHFFRYELLSNVGLPHCLFSFLHIKFCNSSNWCFPCNRFIFVGFWYFYCCLVLLNLFSAAPVYIYWYANSVSVLLQICVSWIPCFCILLRWDRSKTCQSGSSA
jgi:MFS superfamily sulfate permease-like transporter